MQKAVKREDAAFAVAVGTQDKDRVFELTMSVSAQITSEMQPRTLSGVGRYMCRAVEYLIDGIERRGADVTKNDADRADRQRRLPALWLMGQMPRDGSVKHGHTRAPDERKR